MDLRAVESATLAPGIPQAVATGLTIELPPGYEAQVRPRSGLALKHSITVNFGTIDPGYRGEIRVIMFNLGRADYTVERGDRIAQLIIARVQQAKLIESVSLEPTERAGGGMGSTGTRPKISSGRH